MWICIWRVHDRRVSGCPSPPTRQELSALSYSGLLLSYSGLLLFHSAVHVRSTAHECTLLVYQGYVGMHETLLVYQGYVGMHERLVWWHA